MTVDARVQALDLPAGLAGARESMKTSDLHGRVTFAEGSFFDSLPARGDVYMLKSIVHDWDDSKATQILKACRVAMTATSRVVLVERDVPELIDDPQSALQAVMMDLHMMVVLGGRERTHSEYAELMAGAGLRLSRRVPVGAEFAAFEAVPV